MKILLPILSLLIIASCSKEVEVPSEQLVYRNETYYLVNSQEPFTGIAISDESKERFKEGKPHGLQEYYYENGQLEYKANYKDGEWDGPQESYYENGQLESKETYKDGELLGFCEYYSENGQLEYKGNCKDGEM